MGSGSSIMISKQVLLQLSCQSLKEFNKYKEEIEKYPNKLTSLEIYNKLTCKYEDLLAKDNLSLISPISNEANCLGKANEEENVMFVEDIRRKVKEFEELPQSHNEMYEKEDEILGKVLDGLFLINKKHEKNANVKRESNKDLYYCEFCSISFDSKSIFQSHFQSSSMHAKNKKLFEDRKLEAQYELDRLHSVAEEVASTMYNDTDKNLVQDHSSFSKSKILWRKATDIVIRKALVMKFKERLTGRIDLPWGIELIFSGSKYFHKNKQTYDLQYFLHTKNDVVEIIPHLIPYSYAENRLTDTNIESFISIPRIYLCYTELLKSFFHYKDYHSTLTGTLGRFDESEDLFQLHASKSFKFAEHKALGSYITNNLKMHKSKPTSHPPLYLSLPDNIKSSIIYLSIPNSDGFKSLEIDKTFIKNAWILNGVHKT